MTLLDKAERFCAYQERSRAEVEMKLRKLGGTPDGIKKTLESLEEDGYINDERYAKLFASGKFRIKRWGKNKIRAELRMKKIPDNFISNALDTIDDEEYLKTVQHLIKKKEKEVRSQSGRTPSEKREVRSQKIYRFLLSKGFESHLVVSNLKLAI